MSQRDKILSSPTSATQPVPVPEWDETVTVKAMSAGERDDFEQYILKRREKGQVVSVRAVLAARVIVDENGQRVFSDGDVPELAKQRASALQRVFDVAMELSGVTDEDVAELEGN